MYLWPPQWNYIDFLVVLFGYISLAPGVGSISALRVVSWEPRCCQRIRC